VSKPTLNEKRKIGDDHVKILRLFDGVTDGAQNASTFSEDRNMDTKCSVGFYRTPEQFASAMAAEVRHPIDLPTNLQDVLLRNVAWNLSNSNADISRFRLNQVVHMRELAAKLVARDAELKRDVPARAKQIVGDKNLAILEYYTEKLNWPDKEIIRDLTHGFRLVGTMKPSGIFPQKVRLASMTPDQLQQSAKWCRKASVQKIASSGDADLDHTLWNQAIEECGRQWCKGPFTEQEITDLLLTDHWLCNRRFGLKQKAKVRDIDDYSESGVNDCITCIDKLELHDVDDAVSILKTIYEVVSSADEKGSFSFKSFSGTTFSGTLSSVSQKDQLLDWSGKTFDLKAAYKNLFTHDDDRWFTIIALWNPLQKCACFFLQEALPFGASGSVIAFNRCSRLLWAIACYELRVVWFSYFDDFPTLDRVDTAQVTDMAIRSMFLVLGWNLSLDPNKSKPFCKSFAMLGVIVSMEDLAKGDIFVYNKPERIQDIADEIDAVLSSGRCLRPQAASLRGRMQYASNQIFGRIAISTLSTLSEHEFRSRSPFVSSSLREALARFRVLLMSNKPRHFSALGERKPIFVFSDGACEGDGFSHVTIGAVMLDSLDGHKEMFGCQVPQEVVSLWKSDSLTKEQTIAQAEILPAVISRLVWRTRMIGRRIIFCLDNDGARLSLIKGSSASPSSRILINAMLVAEIDFPAWTWFTRVPTHSNPGDAPSRLVLQPCAENLFAKPIAPPSVRAVCNLAIRGQFYD
jgi:hypothetical protein